MSGAALDAFLTTGVYQLLLVWCRLGTVLAMMPGFGDLNVPANVRLLLSMGLCLALLPALTGFLPEMPHDLGVLALLIAQEVLIGLFISLLVRILISVLDLAGSHIASQTGLSSVTAFNPQMNSNASIVSNILVMGGVVILFVTNLDHLIIAGVVGSYERFAPLQAVPIGDLINVLLQMISMMFELSLKLAAPLMVFGLLLNLGLGLMAKLMPQIQVFLVALPLQLLVGCFLFAGLISTLMFIWLEQVDHTLNGLLPGH